MTTKVSLAEDDRILFWCEGCDGVHAIKIPIWTWNLNEEFPTFSPSILICGGSDSIVCHSFVENGMIRYLDDSTHHLSGESVALLDWPFEKD